MNKGEEEEEEEAHLSKMNCYNKCSNKGPYVIRDPYTLIKGLLDKCG